jgi:Aerotolerance regulator N-terminal/von Willebrand factor type A domain
MNWPAFANPWLLAGLAAVGLPVLIHYLTRARPRRIAFPPFKFLMEACAGQQSLHRLRTIVLVIVRCLAVMALVLLFTRPFLNPSSAVANAQNKKPVVLILDASLSMRAVKGGVTLFSRAKAEAADALRGLETGQEAAVILVGATPRLLLPALSPNLPALHEGLVKAEPTFEIADFQSALATAKRLLGGPGIIYIFSDFQKSNWEIAGELPAGCVCRLRPVTSGRVDNLGVVSVRLSPEEPVAGESVEVIASVFNGTPQPREETIRMQVGEFTQERQVTIPAFATADCAFNATFPQEGSFTGKAWLNPDDLREDDIRYVAVKVHKSLEVLLLSDADAGDDRSAAFYVGHALVPSQRTAPGLHIIRRHSQDADRGILETADLFLLVAPASLSGEAVEVITRRVQEGARFLAVLDGPTAPLLVPGSFNPPFQLLRPVVSASGESLVSGSHKLFLDADAGEWSAIRFLRHYQNQVVQGRSGEVLLSYPDGSAAVTLSSVGKGAAAFANVALTPNGGDFVGNPMFPATIHELIRLLRRNSEAHEISPGQSWVIEAPTKGEGAPTVLGPDNAVLQAKVIASGRTSRLALPAARLPGLYTVNQGGTVVSAAAVNIDPRESDTRPISLEAIKPAAGAAITVIRNEEELVLAGKAKPLWPQLAAASATLLALEMVLLAIWRRTGPLSQHIKANA